MMQLLAFSLLLLSNVEARRLGASRQLQIDTITDAKDQVVTAVDQILNPPAVALGDLAQGPLGLCQGNCQSDADCQPGLVCGSTAEGCAAGDFAVQAVCSFPAVSFLGFAPQLEADVILPLGVCQGDCDNDSMCGDGLICFQRTSPSSPLPGCAGIEAFTAEYNRPTDFCVPEIYANTYDAFGITKQPTPSPTVAASATPSPTVPLAQLEMVGNDGLPVRVYPLGPCQADCDGDDECQEGLQCYQRSGTEDMSAWCQGMAVPGEDYCIPLGNAQNGVSAEPTKFPFNVVGNDGRPQGAFPLKQCQGDCDNDIDCQDGLVCMLRTNANLTNFCVGQTGPADYCVPDPATLVVVETPAEAPEEVVAVNSTTLAPEVVVEEEEVVEPVAVNSTVTALADDDLVETEGVKDDDEVFVATERKGILP